MSSGNRDYFVFCFWMDDIFVLERKKRESEGGLSARRYLCSLIFDFVCGFFFFVFIECANVSDTVVPKSDMFLALVGITFLVGCASWWRLRLEEVEEVEGRDV